MSLSAAKGAVFGLAAVAIVSMIHFDTKISGLEGELRKLPPAVTKECSTQVLGANPHPPASLDEQATQLAAVLTCSQAAAVALAVKPAALAP